MALEHEVEQRLEELGLPGCFIQERPALLVRFWELHYILIVLDWGEDSIDVHLIQPFDKPITTG